LFLLPLVRPRKLLRRLLRLPQHPLLLSFWLTVLPRFISSKVGLYRDEKGKAKIKLPLSTSNALSADASSNAKYPDLPSTVCAICWERLEDEAGIKSSGQSMIRSGIPSSDPLDPSSTALAPSTRSANQYQSTSTSSSGLVYADAHIHTPYQAIPCGHLYCYVCITSKLLSEEAAEEMAETVEEGEGRGAWRCLRCSKGVISANREQDDVVLGHSNEQDRESAAKIEEVAAG
jgi:peroxin-2